MDIKERALGESEAWKKAQELLANQKLTVDSETQDERTHGHYQGAGVSCFTDESWKERDATSGVGGFYRINEEEQSCWD
ncbi:unnamed protein product [Cochlearia groenlandica]